MNARDYIEHLRAKPEHVRRSIALGVSGGITALIAVAYVTTLASSGALALDTPAPEASLPPIAVDSAFNDLLGAATAFDTVLESGTGVQVVETESATTLEESDTGEGRTVIPF